MAASRHAGGFLMAHGNQSAGRLEVEVEVRDGKPTRIMSDTHAGHRQFAEHPSDLASRCRIEMGGSLIHEQGVRTHVKCTGEEETLPLTSGKARSALPDLRLPPKRQRRDDRCEPHALGDITGIDDLRRDRLSMREGEIERDELGIGVRDQDDVAWPGSESRVRVRVRIRVRVRVRVRVRFRGQG